MKNTALFSYKIQVSNQKKFHPSNDKKVTSAFPKQRKKRIITLTKKKPVNMLFSISNDSNPCAEGADVN